MNIQNISFLLEASGARLFMSDNRTLFLEKHSND